MSNGDEATPAFPAGMPAPNALETPGAPDTPGMPAPEPDAPATPNTADVGNMVFEDFFPALDLTDAQKEDLVAWFTRDLKVCVRHVNEQRDKWALYRAVYALEYVEKFYPSMGVEADFSSGLLCDNVLKGMDRVQKAVMEARPLFVVDDKTSNVESIELIHRMEWFMHTYFEDQLDIHTVMGRQAFFEFLLDGSMIVEADQMYEKIPQRTLKTYGSIDELVKDEDKLIDKSEYEQALTDLSEGEPVRLLIEEDLVTKSGLQVFIVDKADHLIPPHVYSDEDLKFRGRRMYLTESDLRLLASDGVNWYEKADVEKVLATRAERRTVHRFARGDGEGTAEYLAKEQLYDADVGVLAYDWRRDDDRLSADKTVLPYKNTFAVYRVLAKYGYKAGSDTEGLIPKFCTFDIEPESGTILRARTFPHFEESKNYFHFKLGHMPNSYWGFGYGQRLIRDDFLESNAVSLYLEAAVLSTFRPFTSVHPEYSDGVVPFADGLGPGKIGYVRNQGDFQPYEIPPPPVALINSILPLIETKAENKTNITSLVQGRTESSDPRAPASKAKMLLGEAWLGIDSQIEDWNRTGWNKLAQFVWGANYENAVYQGVEIFDGLVSFPGMAPDLEGINKVTLDELKKDIKWKSQASAELLNVEARVSSFLRKFQFFSPMIRELVQVNPELYKKYFLRWMRHAAQELQLRDFRYLIPTEEEMKDLTGDAMAKLMDNMLTQVRAGEGPEAPQVTGK